MRRASFSDHSPPLPGFASVSPNNLECLLAMSKNLAHPLHPVYDDGWWLEVVGVTFCVLLNSHISALSKVPGREGLRSGVAYFPR